MSQEEQAHSAINKHFIPFASLPESDDFDPDGYLDRMVDNLLGPLRMFRSAMLDLGNLITADPAQRKAFRDYVFQKEQLYTDLYHDWAEFYGLSEKEVTDAVSVVIGYKR